MLKDGVISESGYVAYPEANAQAKFEDGMIKLGSTSTNECHFTFTFKEQTNFANYTKLIINVASYGKSISIYSSPSIPTSYSLPAGTTLLGYLKNAGTIEIDLTNVTALGYLAFVGTSPSETGKTWIDSAMLK